MPGTPRYLSTQAQFAEQRATSNHLVPMDMSPKQNQIKPVPRVLEKEAKDCGVGGPGVDKREGVLA